MDFITWLTRKRVFNPLVFFTRDTVILSLIMEIFFNQNPELVYIDGL